MQEIIAASAPLITTLHAGDGRGRIGLVSVPGTGAPWLDAVQAWGACVVVSMVEHGSNDTSGFPDAVTSRHMEAVHVPSSGAALDARWSRLGESLRARLRDGFDIALLSAADPDDTARLAARLLMELAAEHAGEVARITGAELPPEIPEPEPDTGPSAIRDRAIGAMLGLAVGDAVGTTLEFEMRDSYAPLTDMVGGGPFDLKPGEWTDDTAMSLALADSLLACGGLDETDLLRRFCAWHRDGAYSCTGTCFDIGTTTRFALLRWEATGETHPGSTDPRTAGNGSLMRLAPVAVRYWSDRAALRDAAARQSRTTHGAADAVDACVAFAEILADVIAGVPRSHVLRPRRVSASEAIARILNGSWRGRARDKIRSSGYVAHSLEAALWSVGRTADYREAVLTAANLGLDADTTAAIAGQLAGALYGASGIPDAFLARLAWRARIAENAAMLFEAGLSAR